MDTTGNYRDQVKSLFRNEQFVDTQGRSPGFSEAGLNWENVNKRILTQIIYKGHVLRREAKCRKGLFFVCPKQVYDRVLERLGGHLHEYQPDKGTITFVSFELDSSAVSGKNKLLVKSGQFTTTVDQIAVAFTGPVNLPEQNVYEAAILKALQK